MKGLKILLALVALTVLLTGFGRSCPGEEMAFGLTGRDMTPPYARAMEFGAARKGEELGIKVIPKDSQNDILKQLSQMDSFLVMGVSGLIFEGTH